jgi:hypothetical protein|nr:MAG TPA: hypothetical protein [Caudoviricetes sp.]
MELKGTVEIEETYYKRSLELAFTDYLEEDTRTPKLFRDCIIDRLIEDFGLDITLDEETVTQAVEDTKRFIREALKNI